MGGASVARVSALHVATERSFLPDHLDTRSSADDLFASGSQLIQIAHIIFGGYGAYRLARSYTLGDGALIAGLAYMLMGGFFMQAQHVDTFAVSLGLRGYF